MNIEFDHTNGWMTENAVVKALGLGGGGYVRGLAIPRTDMRKKKAKRACFRYRVEDVKKYLTDHTTIPDTDPR